MRIALVDDEKVYIDEISVILRKLGTENDIEFEISAFSDGESFLRSLDSNSYSIVFMDIYMNGINDVY